MEVTTNVGRLRSRSNDDKGSGKETVATNISELRSKLEEKSKKAESDEDNSGKSSIQSFDDSSESQASKDERLSTNNKGDKSQPDAILVKEPSITLAPSRLSSSSQSALPSPTVAALQSQLNFSASMFRPGGPSRIRPLSVTGIKRSESITSTDDAEDPKASGTKVINKFTIEIPENLLPAGGITPSSIKSSKRISEIQQRLVLDPNMLLPSPASGPASRKHLRGKSSAAETKSSTSVELQNQELNRPILAGKTRRCRSFTKFAVDDDATNMIDEIEKIATQLDETVAALTAVEKTDEQIASVEIVLKPENIGVAEITASGTNSSSNDAVQDIFTELFNNAIQQATEQLPKQNTELSNNSVQQATEQLAKQKADLIGAETNLASQNDLQQPVTALEAVNVLPSFQLPSPDFSE